MGIASQHLKVFLHEHNYKPLMGEFLSFGAQSVFISTNEIKGLFDKFGVSFGQAEMRKDESTLRRYPDGISDRSIFEQFPGLSYTTSDYSSYENATAIIDLNFPVKLDLHNKFDVIYSGGVLDNIFNPAQALINLHQMLKPGGRAIIYEACVYHAGVYCGMSPEWFYSFFAVNDYADVQSYVAVIRQAESQHIHKADLYSFSPYYTRVKNYDYIGGIKAIGGQMYNIVIAEKGVQSSVSIPTQSHYLQEGSIDWRAKYHQYKNSKRVLLPVGSVKNASEQPPIPLLSDHFHYIGSEF